MAPFDILVHRLTVTTGKNPPSHTVLAKDVESVPTVRSWTRPVPLTIASGIAPARPQKFPMVFAKGLGLSGLTSLVILPSGVVPKSTETQGFLKSTGCSSTLPPP